LQGEFPARTLRRSTPPVRDVRPRGIREPRYSRSTRRCRRAGIGSGCGGLEAALERLAEIDVRPSQVVELRFFGGFSVEETAEALGVRVRMVIND
jgi:hypothetical protein